LELEHIGLLVECIGNAIKDCGIPSIQLCFDPFPDVRQGRPLKKSRAIAIKPVNLL